MGLFSIIDGIFDRSIRDVLDDIPLEHDLKAALLGETGRPKTVLNLVIAQEMGLWQVLSAYAAKLRREEHALQGIYIESVQWAQQTFKS